MTQGARDPKQPVSRGAWNLIIAWGAVLLVFWSFRMFGGGEESSKPGYSELRAQIELDNVESIEISVPEHIVRGRFRNPVVRDTQPVDRFEVVLPFDDTAELVEQLAAQGVTVTGAPPRAPWLTYIMSAIPWILLIAFWLFMLRRMQTGGSQALAFGRAGARVVKPEKPEVTFDDVAGAEEAKQDLLEIIDFLTDPGRFQVLGGRLPKGVLLVGPPGTGKTLLARAVAGQAGVPFFSISGSDFVEMFVGVGAARVRDLFRQGAANAPCIIFIDELDAVGRQRGTGLGGGHDEREQTLNQLLVELDGFDTREGVILLSATNRPDVLDPALLRPGRFDRQIVVDLPDVAAREKILAIHAKRLTLGVDVDLATIARGTPGLSGADLANIANEAALFAARRVQKSVTQRDFEDAKDKVMLGAERKSVVLTEEERHLAAYHEAGHTLVNLLIPGMDPIHKVTIVPRGRSLGATFALPEIDRRTYTRDYLLGKIAVAYGGRVAEEIVFGAERITTGAAQDLQQATDIARRMVTEYGMSDSVGPIAVGEAGEQVFLGRTVVQRQSISESMAGKIDAEVNELVRTAYQQARELIETNRELLDALAHGLLEYETLDGPAVAALATKHGVRVGRQTRSPLSVDDRRVLGEPPHAVEEIATVS